jgi:hypothetical protein
MKRVNFYRKPISVFLMATFAILICFWANPSPAASPAPASDKKSGTSLENKESESTGFTELEKSGPASKKRKKFPWLLATLGVGAVAVLIVLLSKKKTPLPSPLENMVLTVNLGAGTTGTPAVTASYNKDQVVNYNYTAQAGYVSLQVKLDGIGVSASGTVAMNSNHTLSVSATPVPLLAATPYYNAADVKFYTPYRIDHPGFDITARKEIAIRAPGSGRFRKKLYYHAGVPRWQVNCDILVGDYAIECLFEPGDHVPQETAQRQFDLLIAEGEVTAGDVLGTLIIASGNEHAYFHWGVRNTKTGLTECPLLYATPQVRDALLALLQRDLPGKKICFDQAF